MTEPDDAYHEYLWGEASPHAFARRRKLGRGVSRYEVRIEVARPAPVVERIALAPPAQRAGGHPFWA